MCASTNVCKISIRNRINARVEIFSRVKLHFLENRVINYKNVFHIFVLFFRHLFALRLYRNLLNTPLLCLK